MNPYQNLLLLLIMVACVAAALWLVTARARERRDRLRILEAALKEGRLDDQMRTDLLRAIAKDRGVRERDPRRTGALGRITVGIGWLTMIAGLGLIAVQDRDTIEAGSFMLVFGFGLVTLPMAIREYDRRREPLQHGD